MKLVLALALASSAALLPSPPTSSGPPAICFPLTVEGKTMPWSDSGFDPQEGQSLASWQEELLPLLESEDALTRMENLRRTAIVLSPLGNLGDATQRTQARTRLLSALRARSVARLLEAKDEQSVRMAAHACFDLGYLQAAFQQLGVPRGDESHLGDAGLGKAELKYAATKLPKDPAIAFGVCLGLFEFYPEPDKDESLKRCLKLMGEAPLVKRNADEVLFHILGNGRYDALVARYAD